MAQIGSFGEVIFEVSSERIRTFNNFSRTSAERWTNHEIIGQKPASEFIGPGLDTVQFTMRFDVVFGVNPRQEMNRLLEMSRSGQVETLIVGGQAMGVHKWKITNLVQRWLKFDGKGNVLVAEADVTLEEYV